MSRYIYIRNYIDFDKEKAYEVIPFKSCLLDEPVYMAELVDFFSDKDIVLDYSSNEVKLVLEDENNNKTYVESGNYLIRDNNQLYAVTPKQLVDMIVSALLYLV